MNPNCLADERISPHNNNNQKEKENSESPIECNSRLISINV